MSLSEAQKQAEEERKERLTYGRFWVWEGYFNEKFKDKWLETAEALKHINEHVLQDIQDYILLKGFKGMKQEQIKAKIENDQRQRHEHFKKICCTEQEERDQAEERFLEHKKKRDYMYKYRPHTYCWNLFEDCSEEARVQHVLRHNADPNLPYVDGRTKLILDNISELGINLVNYEKEKWNQLMVHTHEIFVHDHKIYLEEL